MFVHVTPRILLQATKGTLSNVLLPTNIASPAVAIQGQ